MSKSLWDTLMELWQEQAKFAQDIGKLIDYIYASGFSCTLGEAYRTPEQAEIYLKEGKGIKNSQHCKKLAIDIQLFDHNGNYLTDPKDYLQFNLYWESLDVKNRSGRNFPRPDSNHFERNV